MVDFQREREWEVPASITYAQFEFYIYDIVATEMI